MRLALLVTLLTGCAAGSFDRLPRQAEAEAIVWHGLYGEEGDAPSVEWFEDDGSTFGGCALAGWKVRVMRSDSISSENDGPWITRQFSGTRFAHEMMHIHTFNRTGDIDAAHWRGDWELADETAPKALRDAEL